MLSNRSESVPDVVFGDVYSRLKAMASRQRLRGSASPTLCTTEIVHETYLRMGDSTKRFGNDAQFFAYAARAMRHILTDAARRRSQIKRGGGQARLELADPQVDAVHINSELALFLDDALKVLEGQDPRAAQVVELHYFAGLDLQQVSDALGVGKRTIDRDWRFARAFLAGIADS